jgi:hypothetical protein
MKKRTFIKSMAAGLPMFSTLMPTHGFPAAGGPGDLKSGEIQHMVIFTLKHARDSKAASTFIQDGKRILSAIPGVSDFQAFSQVSKKNDYDFGFSMVFSSRADYEKYNGHPDHVSFVEKRWKSEVSRFLEIDFETPSISP